MDEIGNALVLAVMGFGLWLLFDERLQNAIITGISGGCTP